METRPGRQTDGILTSDAREVRAPVNTTLFEVATSKTEHRFGNRNRAQKWLVCAG